MSAPSSSSPPGLPNPGGKTGDGIDIVERATVFQGHFRIDRYTLRHKRFDGSWTPVFTREVFERGHAAAVLLYDPVTDRVGLAEQFRMGAFAAGWHPWVVEIVAGIVDPGESPEAAAVREAREEAGIEIGELVSIAEVIATPGGSSEKVQVFCARVDATKLGGLYGLVDEGEDIRIFTLAADEGLAWIAEGRIKNATTIIALQWLALHKNELRQRWVAARP
jgi:ADP-ribose pyrophosphatase